jgi:hypothetical protein
VNPRVLNPAVWLRIRRTKRQITHIHVTFTGRADQLATALAALRVEIAELRVGPR